MIEFRNVSFRYRENSGWVLKDLDMTVTQNEHVSIVGKNGSGKSTIACLASGILKPTSGSVMVDGISTTEDRLGALKKVGVVFQQPETQLFGGTVEEDIAFILENLGIPSKEIRRRVDAIVDSFSLSDLINRSPNSLSGGEQQLVSLAAVLVMRPRYLVLDEPTTYLDYHNEKSFRSCLKDLDTTLIWITHKPETERVMVLEGECITEMTLEKYLETAVDAEISPAKRLIKCLESRGFRGAEKWLSSLKG